MKTKLLTICLLLFSSQVFAEDIIMKCHQGENVDNLPTSYTYKYSKSLIGTHKIQSWENGKWRNWCSARSETHKGCRTETSCVKSKMYAEAINTYTNVIPGACHSSLEYKFVLDFLSKEKISIGKYDYGNHPAAKKYNNSRITKSCSRIYD